MKTLEKHTLIYDDECPMCNIYTRAFIKTGMMDKEGRARYSRLSELPFSIDPVRSRNEIALVDRSSGEVTYGLDSLNKVIGNSFPFISKILRIRCIYSFFRILYSFISYNRKSIAPSDIRLNNSCTPSTNYIYQGLFLMLTYLFTSWVLTMYATRLNMFYPVHVPYQEHLICGGQFVFQGALLLSLRDNRLMMYFGNMMTVSFLGSLALLPLVFISGLPDLVYLLYFLVVVGLMFIEHSRRVRLLHMSQLMTFGWITYRLMILFLLFSNI